MSNVLDDLIAFARSLRDAGLPVGTDRLIMLTEALPLIDLSRADEVRAAFRAILIQRQEDCAALDRAFETRRLPHEERDGSSVQAGVENLVLRTWSDLDRVIDKDFGELTSEEHALIKSALVALRWDLEERRTRRWVAGRGRRIDLRRALARSLRTGGEIAVLLEKARRTRPRPIVLLCDVSGSMELYTRTLLLFAHAMSRRRRDVEAFLFSTRLTRITNELRAPQPDAALAAVSRAVRDWSGGTRIGEVLRAFHQRWRRRMLHSHSIVLLISDGWDRGEPGLLREQIARLQRSCHRLIWLNPLIGTFDYSPMTRGLQAALPFVDDFMPVRTLRDVRELAVHLGAITSHGRHRHLHVQRAQAASLGPDVGSGRDRIVHSGM